MINEYELSDIVRITGAKRRTVQFWAESGALKGNPITERAGSGVHRTFSQDEVLIACILNGFARKGIAIGWIIQSAEIVRRVIEAPFNRNVISHALHGSGMNLLITDGVGHGSFWSSNLNLPTLGDVMNGFVNSQDTEPSYILIDLNKCFRSADFHLT